MAGSQACSQNGRRNGLMELKLLAVVYKELAECCLHAEQAEIVS